MNCEIAIKREKDKKKERKIMGGPLVIEKVTMRGRERAIARDDERVRVVERETKKNQEIKHERERANWRKRERAKEND